MTQLKMWNRKKVLINCEVKVSNFINFFYRNYCKKILWHWPLATLKLKHRSFHFRDANKINCFIARVGLQFTGSFIVHFALAFLVKFFVDECNLLWPEEGYISIIIIFWLARVAVCQNFTIEVLAIGLSTTIWHHNNAVDHCFVHPSLAKGFAWNRHPLDALPDTDDVQVGPADNVWLWSV